MPCLRLLPLAAVAALAAATSAPAAYFPSAVIDQSPEILSAGDLDIARDGTGGVAYVKREGGVEHAFVSRFVGGAFLAPERIDGALAAGASQPVVAAADTQRLAVAFVSGGQLFVALRPAGAPGFQAPQLLSASGSDPSIDMSINGATYVTFTTPGAGGFDVRVARLARDATQFEVLPNALDLDGNRAAGDGTKRSQVAVSADGTAVAVWGEDGADGRTHVIGRRIFGSRLSVAPQDLTLDVLDGHAAGAADLPDIDIEDDSSYAWAVFRQRLDDGRIHAVAKRLVGSQFEKPTQVDGFGYPAGADAEQLSIELNGRGVGIASVAGGPAGTFAATLVDDGFFPGVNIGTGAAGTVAGTGVSENNDAYVSWLPGDGSAQLRAFDIEPAKPGPALAGQTVTVSDPQFGPVAGALGMDLGVNRAGDAVAVFVQEAPGGRVLVAGSFDRAPGTFRTYTTSKVRKFARPPLSWAPSFELWGPVTYRVEIDGKPVGTTAETKLTPLQPVADGNHLWRVVATDRRGQETATPTRPLRVDGTPPEIAFRLTGKRVRGRPLTVRARVADGSLKAPRGSGIARVTIDWGDKTRKVNRRTAKHRYARPGKYTIRVSAADRAGGTAVVQQRITIKRK